MKTAASRISNECSESCVYRMFKVISRADRDAFIIAVLSREGKLKCSTKVWTEFSEIVERKHDFHVTESIRQLSMNFDYKRCPIVETATDTPVSYTSVDGQYHIDTVIAEYDTRPFDDAEEFLNYRNTMQNDEFVKVTADLERVKDKSTIKTKGYIGKDMDRKILLSILMGYRSGLYQIPALDGLSRTTHIVKDKKTGDVRLLTPVKCERIQGFPSDWTKEYKTSNGTDEMPVNKRRFLMGNALVVDLVSAMGTVLEKIVSAE